MAKTISELNIKISVNDKELKDTTKGVDKLGKEAKKSGSEMDSAWARSKRGLKSLQAAAKVAGNAIKAMSVGVGAILAAGAGLVTFVNGIANSATEMQQLATSTGVTVEEMNRLSFAAKQSGVDSETLSKSIRDLNKGLAEGAGGKAQEGITSLGLSMKDLGGSAEQNLGVIADALNKIQDPAEKAAISAKLFGEEGGPKLASLLAQGSEGIKKQADAAKQLDKSQVDNYANFSKNMKALQETLMGLLADVLEPLLPIITMIAEGFSTIFTKLIESGYIEKITELFGVLIESLFEIADELFPVFEDLLNSGLFDSLIDTLKILTPIIVDLIKFVMPSLKMFVTLMTPLVDILNIILQIVGDLIDGITDLFDAFGNWISQFEFVKDLKDGFMGAASAIGIFSDELNFSNAAAEGLNTALRETWELKNKLTGKEGKYADVGGVKSFGYMSGDDAAKSKRKKELLEKGESQGITEAERDLLVNELGTTPEEANKLLKNKKGSRGGGRGKKESDKPDVTSNITLTDALTAFRSGRGSASQLAEVAKSMSMKTPETKDIKPTVAISFYNLENNFDIKGVSDPMKVADQVIVLIKDTMKAANAKAGNALDSNLIS